MTTFADSSALVKLYADEDGHGHVRRIAPIVVSRLARVEVPAALWRKHRMGELTTDDVAVLVADFEADWFGTPDEPPRFIVVGLAGSILERASRLTSLHGLRSYDALQLATALEARSADPTCTRFAAFDDALRAAALIEGFTLVPTTQRRG